MRGRAMWLVLAVAVVAVVGLGALAVAYRRMHRRLADVEATVKASSSAEAIVARAQGRRHLKALGVLAAAGWAAHHLRGRPAAALAAATGIAAVAGLVVLLDPGSEDEVSDAPAVVEPPRHPPLPSTTIPPPDPPVSASATGTGEDAAAPVVAAPSGAGAAAPPEQIGGGGQPVAQPRPDDPPPPSSTTVPPPTTEPPDPLEPLDLEPPQERCGLGVRLAVLSLDVDVCVLPAASPA